MSEPQESTAYTAEELAAYVADKIEDARFDGEFGDARGLERAQMEAQAARSGWIPLEHIALRTSVDADELFHSFAGRYTLALAPGGKRWVTRWFDAFDWLQDHYANEWNAESEAARSYVAELVEAGISEESALDKARREFVNERAALPISKFVGIHTLGDTGHIHEGYSVIGLDGANEPIGRSDEYGWEPYSELEAEYGFPIRGEGSDY
jgi:hypothetical protein